MTRKIIEAIVAQELNKAKTLIHESMNEKLGILLESKLEEYAPTIFDEVGCTNCTADED